ATQAREYLLINPRASKPTRNWPVSRNAEIARLAMARHGIGVALCGGPGEDDRAAAREIAQAAPGVLDLSGQTDLPKLFALIAGARVLLSPDSGPVHIARAFDVPVVGLYADARSAKTGPYRRMRWSVDHWADAVKSILGKDPSRVPWDTRIHDARSMELITVSEVADKLAAALAAARG
ncbi:MAG TPA: glycosyltransferase family 9 protein, partial [Nevskiaceae bacterium]|nr:glycosyltransferase family 9 protein [Nevskiaceae bacterium]